MKFDPFVWSEVKSNEEIEVEKGWLRLRASAPGALYVQAQGVEALVGLGASFDVEVSEALMARFEAPKATRVFLHRPDATSFVASGEVFTNIDRMPDESGSVVEVKRALRQLELERRAVLRDIRAERDELAAERAAAVPKRQPNLDPAMADPALAPDAPAAPASAPASADGVKQ